MSTQQSQSRPSRRLILRGAGRGAAAAIALPTLSAMLNGNGTALADGTSLPLRFGIWWWGDGVRLKRWTPKSVGAGADWALSDELAPLTAVKAHIVVVSGTRGPGGGHHGGSAGMTTGAPYKDQGAHPAGGRIGTVSRASIDQVVAAAVGKTTRLRSLEVGVSSKVITDAGTVLAHPSHNGPDNPNPAERNAQQVFKRLFGTAPGGAAPDAQSDARRAVKTSILDLVRTDAQQLQARLGTQDRGRIDQHLESIRSLEKMLAPTGAIQGTQICRTPGAPGPYVRPDSDEATLKAVNLAMTRLTAMALACDLTRVFTFQFAASNDHTTYKWLAATDVHHQMTHNEPGDQPIVHNSVAWKMARLAELVTALDELKEGAGSVLDRCAVMATTDVADGRLHSRDDFPMIVFGRAGGKLRSDLHYRSTTGETTMKVHLTLLQALGLNVSGFGTQADSVGYATETLKAIEA